MAIDKRVGLFVLVVLVCAGGVAGYVRWRQAARPAANPSSSAFLDPGDPAAKARVNALRASPHVMFLSRRTDSFDQVGMVAVAHPAEPLLLTTPLCERSHFGSQGGLCLVINRDTPSPRGFAVFVDRDFKPIRQLPLNGLPIRARMAPDHRRAAATVFVTGENYAGDFTTRTTLFDLERGEAIADLEQFTVERDGRAYKEVDFNFWGVTFFANSDRFLATLGTGGKRLLVEGDVTRRHFKVIGADVECPSLSPDGKRIVFKRSSGNKAAWRLWVKELETGEEWPITAEDRYVDDQAEWLDNERVLYGLLYGEGLPENTLSIWISKVSRDSGFDAEVFIRSASSPSVIR